MTVCWAGDARWGCARGDDEQSPPDLRQAKLDGQMRGNHPALRAFLTRGPSAPPFHPTLSCSLLVPTSSVPWPRHASAARLPLMRAPMPGDLVIRYRTVPVPRHTRAQFLITQNPCIHIQGTFQYYQGHFRPQILGTPQNQCALRPKTTVIGALPVVCGRRRRREHPGVTHAPTHSTDFVHASE